MIDEQWQDCRLDRLLASRWPGLPGSAIQRRLRTGQVRVNGRRAQGNQRLQAGDTVRLPPVTLTADPATPAQRPPERVLRLVQARVLWQDEHLLVLNKPEGIAVHSGSTHAWGLVDVVRLLCAPPHQPELCHRLDLDTSGCLVFGLTPLATRRWMEMLRNGMFDKRYIALVRGAPRQATGTISVPLTKGMLRAGERMVAVATGEDGETAITRFRRLDTFHIAPDLTVSQLELKLLTGRTHQIRAHLQWAGMPIAGDPKYGDASFNQLMRQHGLRRMFLHAHTLAFTHPVTGHPMTVTAPLDPSLDNLLGQMAIASPPSHV